MPPALAAIAAPSSEVVRLTSEDLAGTFGGQQTEEGVVTTVGQYASYGGGVVVAGQVNAGMATAGFLSTVGRVLGGASALAASYGIAQVSSMGLVGLSQ
jgi:hypothetical protein